MFSTLISAVDFKQYAYLFYYNNYQYINYKLLFNFNAENVMNVSTGDSFMILLYRHITFDVRVESTGDCFPPFIGFTLVLC